MGDQNVIKDLRNSDALIQELCSLVDEPVRIMVVCGTHNRAILKYNLRELLPEQLAFVSGPGCSVCVMPAGHIDAFVKVGRKPGVLTAVCEDLLKVQGSEESLESIRDKGALVEVISSPNEGLRLALDRPDKIVVYPAVGFEANAPSLAETILEAASLGVENFCVIPSIRLLPPTLDTMLYDPEINVQGLLCSEHINAITDTEAYSFLAKKHRVACSIVGFELSDILNGLINLVKQIKAGRTDVDRTNCMVFSSEENDNAARMVSEVFFAVDTDWRGLGTVEESGFVIRDELSLYDATKRFKIRFSEGEEPCMCQCDQVISGLASPTDCPAFGISCTKENPVGPCMISKEGLCASYYLYAMEKKKTVL